MSNETIAVIATILTSSIAASVWVTSRVAELKSEMKHAFLRIAALEDVVFEPPRTRQSRQRTR